MPSRSWSRAKLCGACAMLRRAVYVWARPLVGGGMEVYLETERLVLRRFTEADVDNLVELDSDPEVMRYVTGKTTPRDEIEHDILPAFLRYYERGDRYGFWATIEKASGNFLGW